MGEPEPFAAVQMAFGKQALHYDEDDSSNQILTDWRKKVYEHVKSFMTPQCHLLELNAGTGIDALHFVQEGHSVHATDISPGMVQKIQEKADQYGARDRFTSQICSFETLSQVTGKNFEYVFSNFGGLNCCQDLSRVIKHLPRVLKAGAYVTWVIMPPLCPWEISRILRGKQIALRRLHKAGVSAQLEGAYFQVYYYSLIDLDSYHASVQPNSTIFPSIDGESGNTGRVATSFSLTASWLILKCDNNMVCPSVEWKRAGDKLVKIFQKRINPGMIVCKSKTRRRR